MTIYNPTLHAMVSTSFGLTNGGPMDSRSMFYESTIEEPTFRDYSSVNEVLFYLNTFESRFGHFPIYIHFGGTLTNGVWSGGTMEEYWFKDGTEDYHLVPKNQP